LFWDFLKQAVNIPHHLGLQWKRRLGWHVIDCILALKGFIGVLKIFFKKIFFKLIYIYIILLYFQTPTGPNAVDFEHLAINFLLAMIRE
jgi:hypothetical protein